MSQPEPEFELGDLTAAEFKEVGSAVIEYGKMLTQFGHPMHEGELRVRRARWGRAMAAVSRVLFNVKEQA